MVQVTCYGTIIKIALGESNSTICRRVWLYTRSAGNRVEFASNGLHVALSKHLLNFLFSITVQ